mgnify:CR=1 FL=1
MGIWEMGIASRSANEGTKGGTKGGRNEGKEAIDGWMAWQADTKQPTHSLTHSLTHSVHSLSAHSGGRSVVLCLFGEVGEFVRSFVRCSFVFVVE